MKKLEANKPNKKKQKSSDIKKSSKNDTSRDKGRSRTPAKEINKRPPIGDPKPNPNKEVID